MNAKHRISLVGLLSALVLLLLWTAVAQAAPESEPNDSLLLANGPLSATTYEGEIATETDVDWYWLQLGGQQQISFNITVLNANRCGTSPDMDLVNYWGQILTPELRPEQSSYEAPTANGVFTWTTPPGAATYYVRVGAGYAHSAGCKYSFSVGPASAYAPAPPVYPVVEVGPSYNSPYKAYSPLQANTTYQGTFTRGDTSTWMDVEVAANQSLSIVQNAAQCQAERSVSTLVYAGGNRHWVLRSLNAPQEPGEGHTRESLKAVPYPTAYEIEVSGGTGCVWQLEVGPPKAIIFPHVSHVSPCKAARRQLGRARAALRGVELANHVAKTARERGFLHHKIEAHRRAVRAARHQVKVQCT